MGRTPHKRKFDKVKRGAKKASEKVKKAAASARQGWLNLTPTEKKIIKYGLFAVGGLALAGYGWNKYQAYQKRIAEANILDDGSPESKANMLRMAFKNDTAWGIGTNVEVVRRIFRGIKSKKEYERIRTSYRHLTEGKSLDADLEDELTTSELNEMMAILASKPDTDNSPAVFHPDHLATRIYNAITYTWFGIPQTDDDALLQAFNDIPTQAAWEQVRLAYDTQYGNMESDLDGELWMWGDLEWREIRDAKPLNGMLNHWQKVALEWRIKNYQNKVRSTRDNFLNRINHVKR